MRVIATSLLILSTLTACNQPATTGSAPKSNEGAVAAAPVKFEIRDFSLNEQTQSYGGAIYRGRGTLVTKDAAVSKGNYMVWVSGKQAHKNDESWRTLVLLHDGVGTFETVDYQTKEDAEKHKAVKYSDWKILGYAALGSGTIEQETPTATK